MSESCPKIGDVPKSPFYTVAALVPSAGTITLKGKLRLARVPWSKKRGYVAHDQINSVLPSEEVNSEQIEGVLADETEVIEPDERRQRNGKDVSTEPEMQNEGGEIVELKRPAPAKGKSSELSARTDDPVRMYLREMGSVELLSR